MITQPLIEYLVNHVQYIPNSNNNPCIYWNDPIDYDRKYELIKETRIFSRTITHLPRCLFQRYMNNDEWKW